MVFSEFKEESQRLELKKELTDKLEKEVVAFLNAKDGGVIIIGVDDNGQVVGVNNADSLQLKIKDRLKHNITPSTMGLFDVVLLQQEDKTLIKIIVASGSEKPYYLSKIGMSPKGCFIRIGSASEPMPSDMIETLFATRVRNPIGNISSRYQDLTFAQLKIYYNETSYTLNEQFANNLELLTKGKEYNYAAYLLADRNGCSIKIDKYSGMDRIDLIESEDFGHCCLVKATKSVLDKLNIENRTYTQLTAKERIERKMLDPIALREVVINAIIHNDFNNEIPPKFELFSDRLEITSAGTLPEGFSQNEFFDGYSIPRNKELMRVFRDLDMAKQMGSGITRILQTYPKTIYRFSNNFIHITIPFAPSFIESQAAMQVTTQAAMQVAAQGTMQATTQAAMQVIANPTMQASAQVTMQASMQTEQLLLFCDTPKSRSEIQAHLGLKNRYHFRKSILKPLIASGKLLLTLPDKPTSPKQQFYAAVSMNKSMDGGDKNGK